MVEPSHVMMKTTVLYQQVPVRTSPQLPPGRPTTTSTPLVSSGGPRSFGDPIVSPLLQGNLRLCPVFVKYCSV